MRFALVATSVAAVVAVPFAVSASGAQMTSAEFLSAVQCAAYEDSVGSDVGGLKFQLNAEAQRQAPETVAEARAIARQAVNTEAAANAVGVDLACAPGALIAETARNAV
jgi:hypothetical protein